MVHARLHIWWLIPEDQLFFYRKYTQQHIFWFRKAVSVVNPPQDNVTTVSETVICFSYTAQHILPVPQTYVCHGTHRITYLMVDTGRPVLFYRKYAQQHIFRFCKSVVNLPQDNITTVSQTVICCSYTAQHILSVPQTYVCHGTRRITFFMVDTDRPVI